MGLRCVHAIASALDLPLDALLAEPSPEELRVSGRPVPAVGRARRYLRQGAPATDGFIASRDPVLRAVWPGLPDALPMSLVLLGSANTDPARAQSSRRIRKIG
jgi:hypothetical protein